MITVMSGVRTGGQNWKDGNILTWKVKFAWRELDRKVREIGADRITDPAYMLRFC